MESSEAHVDEGDSEDEQEGWQDEGDGCRECATGACLEVPDPHDDLSSERPGHRLAQRDAVQEVLPIEPPALLDEVSLHVADRGDRTPEAPRAQAEEVPDHAREGGRLRRSGRLGAPIVAHAVC